MATPEAELLLIDDWETAVLEAPIFELITERELVLAAARTEALKD